MNEEIERSIITKYRKDIYAKFTKAVREYELINENDKVAVCISGGKDSFLLAKLLQELQKHGKVKFDIEFITMNPGYRKENMDLIIENSKKLNIPLKVFESDIFSVVEKTGSTCYLCARMRRGYLYSKAKELGCNKIALGHHFDDVIETTLLNMFYGAEIKTMLPKLHSSNFEGMELIRPMYLIKEKDIISWAKNNNLSFLRCACKIEEKGLDSKRLEMKKLIDEFRKQNKNIDKNIFTSMENINMDVILGYRKNNEKHSFLEEYDKKTN